MINEMKRERNIQPRKRQDVRREDDNNNKRTTKNKTKNRNADLRANSLGPKPSFLFCFLLCWCFFHVEKKSCFPLRKRVFLLIFECLPFVIPFVLPSLSHFPFSLSRSLFCYFRAFFLPWFSFIFPSLFFVFLSCLVSLLLFHAKKRTSRYHI